MINARFPASLAPLHVLCSDEVLLLQETVDELRTSARNQGYTEREVYTVEAHFRWHEVTSSQQSLSLFGDKKIIELRIPSGKPGKDGATALAQMVQNLSDEVLLIVTLPRLDKASKASVWFKALSNAANGHLTEIATIDLSKLPAWIKARLQQNGQSVSNDTLQWLATQFEGNMLAAHQEIQKLALLYPSGTLNDADVRDAVLNVARYDMFKLGEAMLAGDVARTARMLEGLRAEGEAIVPIVWSLTNDIRVLNQLKTATERGEYLPSLLKQNRIWGVREQLIPRALPRLSAVFLQKCLQRTADLDRMAKGMDKDDPWDATLRLATQIAMRAAK